jgi:hypothetical protein
VVKLVAVGEETTVASTIRHTQDVLLRPYMGTLAARHPSLPKRETERRGHNRGSQDHGDGVLTSAEQEIPPPDVIQFEQIDSEKRQHTLPLQKPTRSLSRYNYVAQQPNTAMRT